MTAPSPLTSLLLVFLALLACGEPSPRVLVALRLPSGVAPDATRLHLEMETSRAPGAAPHFGPVTPSQTKTLKDGFDVELGTAIGPTQYVFLRGYYDTNGNGVEDHGDYAGALTPSPFVARDRGLCAGNENRAPEIVLAPVP